MAKLKALFVNPCNTFLPFSVHFHWLCNVQLSFKHTHGGTRYKVFHIILYLFVDICSAPVVKKSNLYFLDRVYCRAMVANPAPWAALSCFYNGWKTSRTVTTEDKGWPAVDFQVIITSCLFNDLVIQPNIDKTNAIWSNEMIIEEKYTVLK